MLIRGITSLTLIGCVALLSGCPRSNGGPGGAGIPIDQLGDRYLPVVCAKLFECAPPRPTFNDDDEYLRLLLQNPERCVAVLRESLTSDDVALLPDALRDAVNGGTATYDGVAAQGCVDAIENAGCGISFFGSDGAASPTQCDDAFEGTVAIDGACRTSEECAGDAYCATDVTCPGVCAAAIALGNPCVSANECSRATTGEGVSCHHDGSAQVCVEVISAAESAAGGACGEVLSGNTLTVTGCAANLFCKAAEEFASTGTCMAILATGAACATGDHCPSGNVCVAGTCTAFTVAGLGGECDADSAETHTRICDIFANLECDASGHCVSIGDRNVGARCMRGDGINPSCNSGLYCEEPVGGEDGTCAARKATGVACDRDEECESGECDSSSDTCNAVSC